MGEIAAALADWWTSLTPTETAWLAVGLAGQGMFFMRFLIQWVTTERARRSIVPEVFWYFSLVGAVALFAYGIHRAEPVLILGQSVGFIVYTRNIYFIRKENGERRAAALAAASR